MDDARNRILEWISLPILLLVFILLCIGVGGILLGQAMFLELRRAWRKLFYGAP
jgi:hypothetical protein